jgi:hypothetical protein
VLKFNKTNTPNSHGFRLGVLVVFAALVLIVSVVGCGGSDATSPSSSGQAKAAAPHVSKADLREAQLKSQRLAKLYERSWREYQNE